MYPDKDQDIVKLTHSSPPHWKMHLHLILTIRNSVLQSIKFRVVKISLIFFLGLKKNLNMTYTVYVDTRKLVFISGELSQGLSLNIFKNKCIWNKRFYALNQIHLSLQWKDIKIFCSLMFCKFSLINYF